MTRKSLLLAVTAVAILVVCGALAAASPEFKAHAVTVAIAFLAVISLTGVLIALIAPLLPDSVETYGPDPAPEMASEMASERVEHLIGARDTGDAR